MDRSAFAVQLSKKYFGCAMKGLLLLHSSLMVWPISGPGNSASATGSSGLWLKNMIPQPGLATCGPTSHFPQAYSFLWQKHIVDGRQNLVNFDSGPLKSAPG